MKNTKSNGFTGIFLVALCALFLLTGTGFYFYTKIVEAVTYAKANENSAVGTDRKPEVLAVAVPENDNKFLAVSEQIAAKNDDNNSNENNNNGILAVSEQTEPENLENKNLENLEAENQAEKEPEFANDWEANLDANVPVHTAKKPKENVKAVKSVVFVEPESNKNADKNKKSESVKKIENNKSNKKSKSDKKQVKNNNKKNNLEAFKVNAMVENKEDLLPDNNGTSLKDLNADMNKKTEKKKSFLDGKGVIGDIYRGAKNILDKTDKATLDASRTVIGNTTNLDIEKAKLRPSSGGAKLKLELSPNIFKRNKNKNDKNNKSESIASSDKKADKNKK